MRWGLAAVEGSTVGVASRTAAWQALRMFQSVPARTLSTLGSGIVSHQRHPLRPMDDVGS